MFQIFQKFEIMIKKMDAYSIVCRKRMVWIPLLCISRFSSKLGFSQCFGHVIRVSAKIINNDRQRRFCRGEILDLIIENDLGKNLDKTFDEEFESSFSEVRKESF